MSLALPILHAGGFSWDEALVLAVAILAVPAISWFNGWKKKNQTSDEPRPRRSTEPVGDDAPSDIAPVD